MRKYTSIFLVLCTLAFIFCGCQSAGLNTVPPTTTEPPATMPSTQNENVYSYMFIDAMAYSTAAELVDASVIVFLGTVKQMSFAVLDYDTGRIPNPNDSNANCGLFTLYEIQVNTLYKGTACETVTLALAGGVSGPEYKEEQLQLLASYGLEQKILLINQSKMLETGGEYVFTLKFRDGWSAYLCGTTVSQCAFRKEDYGWEYEGILAYFAQHSEG